MIGEQLIQDLRVQLGVYFHTFDGTRDLGRGTAFPASADLPGGLQTDDRFFRTDLGYACAYDGTRWLTLHEYAITFAAFGPTQTATYYAGAAPANLAYAAPRSDYSLYVTRYIVSYILNTNQTGVNYWSLALQTNTATFVTTDTQNAVTAGNFYTREGSDNADRGVVVYFRVQGTAKAGAPGGIWIAGATVYYRLIIP